MTRMGQMLDDESMWERFVACDSTYDGVFYAAVKTTRIYCRPSCKSRKPLKANVEFYMAAEEAEAAGYRACKRCQPERLRSPQDELVSHVKAHIERDYKQKLTLEDMARHAGVSPFYMERLFKQQAGMSPREYVEKIRVEAAANLLRTTGRTNLDICYDAGFQSPSNYYKAFRRVMGCAPSEVRGVDYENEG